MLGATGTVSPEAVLAGLLVMVGAKSISWVFAFVGVVARSASSVQGISMLILFLLTFLSNAIVPLDTLPSGLRAFARANPVLHLITAVRDLLNEGTVGLDLLATLRGSGAMVAIFAPLTLRAYMRKAWPGPARWPYPARRRPVATHLSVRGGRSSA